MLSRGAAVTEVRCDDWRLIADALADQSRRVAARARSRACAGPALAGARANAREESDRLAALAAEFGRAEVVVRCRDTGTGELANARLADSPGFRMLTARLDQADAEAGQ
jgi:hypothetical protein